MVADRKAAEAEILSGIEGLIPGSPNTALYKQKFAAMSDEEFATFIEDLDKKETRLCIVAPNFGKHQLQMENIFAVCDKIGYKLFQRIQMPAMNGKPAYLTPNPYMVISLPLRRQAQIKEKKISVPEDNNSVDNFTGQPTGKSKGSKISHPEVQVLASLGLEHSLEELMKYRGGDEKGGNAMNTMISRTGGVSMTAIAPYAGMVRSTKTMYSMLTGMHLRNSILKR